MSKPNTLEEMPDFLESKDLVALGIYNRLNATYVARLDGSSPPYIKLKHRILYPKQQLIEWLQERTVNNK